MAHTLQLADMAHEKSKVVDQAVFLDKRCHTVEEENRRLRDENDRLRDELRFLRDQVRVGHDHAVSGHGRMATRQARKSG